MDSHIISMFKLNEYAASAKNVKARLFHTHHSCIWKYRNNHHLRGSFFFTVLLALFISLLHHYLNGHILSSKFADIQCHANCLSCCFQGIKSSWKYNLLYKMTFFTFPPFRMIIPNKVDINIYTVMEKIDESKYQLTEHTIYPTKCALSPSSRVRTKSSWDTVTVPMILKGWFN